MPIREQCYTTALGKKPGGNNRSYSHPKGLAGPPRPYCTVGGIQKLSRQKDKP